MNIRFDLTTGEALSLIQEAGGYSYAASNAMMTLAMESENGVFVHGQVTIMADDDSQRWTVQVGPAN